MNELTKTPSNLPKLRPKVMKFAHLFLECGNATQAYIDAGYSENGARQSAFKLLTNTDLATYLEHQKEIARKEHEAIFGTVIKRTNEITKKAERGRMLCNSKGDPVKVDGEPVYEGDTTNALKGLDQLSKLGGLYTTDDNSKVPQVWTGIEIDYGDGTLKVVTGTGPIQTVQKTAEEEAPGKR